MLTLKGINFDQMHACICNGEMSGLKEVQEAMSSSLESPWPDEDGLSCLLKNEDGVTVAFDSGRLISPTLEAQADFGTQMWEFHICIVKHDQNLLDMKHFTRNLKN